MKKILLASCALVSLQTFNIIFSQPAAALVEPQRMRADDRGDDRVRQVYWRVGVVIQLLGARGQTMMVEMPKGMEFAASMQSDQNLIKPDQYTEIDLKTGNTVPPKQPKAEEGCTISINMKTCVQRDRFIFFQPYVDLDHQSFPMIFTEKKKIKGKDDEITEHAVVFEVSTVKETISESGAVIYAEKPYYAVRVLAGDPPASPVETQATAAGKTTSNGAPSGAAPAAHSGSASIAPRPQIQPVTRWRPREPSQSVAPPPIVNDKYIIQGDSNMLGR